MKRPKFLYILNIAKRVNNFSYTSMLAAKKLGFEFHIAGNWSYVTEEERRSDEKKYGIKIHQIDFIRTPYHPGNIRAYKQLREIAQKENFDVIHCNTPIGGVIGRLIGKKLKKSKVIYQAHGFHFYKGAPKINWMLYYPVEKWLARYTDAIITINSEDYKLAKAKFKPRANGNVYYVPGVGIDSKTYFMENISLKKVKRQELGVPEDAVMLVSVGELNANKNNAVIINAISRCSNRRIHYVLCGIGPLEQELNALVVEHGLAERVHFLGYRSDIKEILASSDIFVMPSIREGLSRSIMEAMSSGLPCVVSKIRGNVDLVEDGLGGELCAPLDVKSYADAIDRLAGDSGLRHSMSQANLKRIKQFDVSVVTEQMTQIYKKEFKGTE